MAFVTYKYSVPRYIQWGSEYKSRNNTQCSELHSAYNYAHIAACM